ncbi:MAG: tetratricopeptide repeat protein, partial [Planctomycetaceae bacterium]|nr:tetratricopeptide repeat protein [Planctomycetaceae bacterium]
MKRLNVKLLIWILVISGVSLGAIVGLHAFQVSRTSGSFLKLAEQSEAEKDYAEAVSFYQQYLVHHPDNAKVQAKFAMLMVELAEQPDGGRMALPAMGALQKALQLDEQNTEVRGRMAKFLVRFRRIDDADAQLQILKKAEPENPEWNKQLAACRIFAGKYPEAIELLQAALALDPHDVSTYRQLAVLQFQQLDDKELMNKTLDEMIAANPESGTAYLTRFQFRSQEGRKEEAAADLAKALELAPDDINTLLTAAQVAEAAEDFATALQHLETAVAKHPEDFRPYLSLARIERRQNRLDAAIANIERGLKALPKNPELTMGLWELKLAANDVPAAYQILEQMAELGVRPEFLERCRAQTLLADRKVMQALTTLNSLRPKIAAAELLIPVDLLRAQCYEQLGQTDLQIEAYRQVLFNDQTNRMARLGMATALSRSGQADEAVEELTAVASSGDVPAALSLLQILIGQQMRQPAAERDWSRCENLLAQLMEKLPDNPALQNVEVEFLAQKGDFAAAREKLTKLQEADPKGVGPWVARIELASQENGVAAGQMELEAARAALGDVAALRGVEINLLLRQGNEDAKKKLDALVDEIDKLPAGEQSAMRGALAQALMLFGDREKPFELLQQVVKNSPNDLLARLSLFRVAREAGDDEKMQIALDLIKESVGTGNSSWQYAEAARIVSAVGRNKLPVADLDKARKLIDSALAQRPNWGPLHGLLAEIEQRQGNIDLAIVQYQRAFELGEQNPQTVRALVMLLVLRNRAAEAEQIVNSIPRAREMLGPRVNAMIDMLLGREKEALASAQEAAELGKDDYSVQLWYGNVMLRAGKFPEALQAFERAKELAADVPDTWLAIINFYVATNDLEKAKATIAEAEAKLPAERKERSLAMAYELVRDFKKAEPLYEAALKQSPDDLNLLRQMATFYSQTQNPQRLVDLLQTIVRESEAAGTPGEAHGRWARRTLAQLLASSRNTAEVRKAIDFLDKTLPQIKPDLD